jgi:hypothetical protein
MSAEDEKTFQQLVEEVIGSLLSREISKISEFDRSLLRLSAQHRSSNFFYFIFF